MDRRKASTTFGYTFVAVMTELTQVSRDHELTPDEVSALLIAHGFTDQSDRPLGANNG